MGHFAKMNGLHLKHSDVEDIYSVNHGLADKAVAEGKSAHEIKLYRDRSIRAFLLFLVCCTIFSNKSSYYVDVVYLQYFQDLSAVREWNWGAAALVHLQHYLDDACLVTVNQMAGYMSLLQGWIISHFPGLSVWAQDPIYSEVMPRNAKFVPGAGHREPSSYRNSLDNIQTYDCVFSPYDDHRHVRPLINSCWFSGWLRCGNLKAKHLPERVLRQFKHVQGIPRKPDLSATPGMSLCEIDRVFMEELDLRMIAEEMRGQAVVSAWDHEPGYMTWFYKVSHPVMRPVQTWILRINFYPIEHVVHIVIIFQLLPLVFSGLLIISTDIITGQIDCRFVIRNFFYFDLSAVFEAIHDFDLAFKSLNSRQIVRQVNAEQLVVTAKLN
ncbi:unnamed protein product [Trifolium pratense]|uniref:Uncharacterized protein n=1 Tax=Trifolium pratense TaxID=57577 RepID=A0ACB0IBP6_TRIPR|nr:unnamed protein product [Trifolium pratense]